MPRGRASTLEPPLHIPTTLYTALYYGIHIRVPYKRVGGAAPNGQLLKKKSTAKTRVKYMLTHG